MLLAKLTSSRQSSPASRRSAYAKAAACSVCHVPHQSTVRRIEAVLRSRQGWQCHCCLCLTDPKRERFSCTSPERKKLNSKRESIINISAPFLPSLLVGCHHQVYSGLGSRHCHGINYEHYLKDDADRVDKFLGSGS